MLPLQGLPLSFISSIEVSLDPILDCDLVLGMDWVGVCHVAMLDGRVEFHSMSPEWVNDEFWCII